VAGEVQPGYEALADWRLGGAEEETEIIMLRQIASVLVVGCIAAGTAARAEPRAVIELFTSQGCSSCPAADRLLAELARDRSLLAMTLAVDYWDYLGWKDTLALSGHTNRQRAYAKARGDREVYTPQAVVNGIVHALGSDRVAIERAIERTRQAATPLTLPITMTVADGKLTVNVPAAKNGRAAAEVWLCPITRAVDVAIKRGENHGRTITYANVVRRWIKLGDWNGAAESYNVAIKDVQHGEIDSIAVVVQSGVASAPRLMLGAAQIALR
jgi:hypothetical protein